MEAASETETGMARVEQASLPKIAKAPAAAEPNADTVGEAERNPIFDALVTPEEDVARPGRLFHLQAEQARLA